MRDFKSGHNWRLYKSNTKVIMPTVARPYEKTTTLSSFAPGLIEVVLLGCMEWINSGEYLPENRVIDNNAGDIVASNGERCYDFDFADRLFAKAGVSFRDVLEDYAAFGEYRESHIYEGTPLLIVNDKYLPVIRPWLVMEIGTFLIKTKFVEAGVSSWEAVRVDGLQEARSVLNRAWLEAFIETDVKEDVERALGKLKPLFD